MGGDSELETVANVALQLHDLLGIHRTSIIERHMPPLGQYTPNDAYSEVLKLCMDLSSYTSAVRSRDTRILACKAIITLAVEDPCARKAFKEPEVFNQLSECGNNPEGFPAFDAVVNLGKDDVHKLWSKVITEPVSLNDMRVLLNYIAWNSNVRKDLGAIANDDMLMRKSGPNIALALVSLDGMPERSARLFAGDDKVFTDLAKSLQDPTSLYVAGLYVDHAIKLAKNGPSENAVQIIVHHLRHVLQHDKTSIIERHSKKTRPEDSMVDIVKELRLKVLKFLMHPNTATSAMEEVIALIVDDPYIRDEMRKCTATFECLRVEGNSDKLKEIRVKVQNAINDEETHKLWSDAIERLVDNDRLGPGGLKDIFKSLVSKSKANYLAKVYLERLKDISEKNLTEACYETRRLLGHDQTTFIERAKARPQVDVTGLQSLIGVLIQFVRKSDLLPTRMSALNAIIEMAIEDSRVRKALREKDPKTMLEAALKDPTKEPTKVVAFHDRIKTILHIIQVENEELHELWSSAIAKAKVPSDVQQLETGTVEHDNADLVKFDKALNNLKLEYLTASLYVGHAMEAMQKEDASKVPHLPPMVKLPCKKCGIVHSQYRMSSNKLFKYILQSASHGSLEDLTGKINSEGREGTKLGEGGFANVSMVSVGPGGKIVAAKVLKSDVKDEKEHCKGLLMLRNFARELRILARLSHPNVLKIVGYVLYEKEEKYCIATEWMKRGDLQKCMGELTALERFQVSLDIAKGMCYLHKKNIVHGDLKTPNVLVSPSGAPVLADFGLARMAESLWSKGFYSTVTAKASSRWVPYEYYHVDDSALFRPGTETDVWSFGMTVLELLTLEVPYADKRSEGTVAKAIMDGVTPGRNKKIRFEDGYARLEDDLWSLCQRCWNLEPKERLSMPDVLDDLIKVKYCRGIV